MDCGDAVRGCGGQEMDVSRPAEARSPGTIESNGDKTIANWMKKRGMSWTIPGAQRMVEAIQLDRNSELPKF